MIYSDEDILGLYEDLQSVGLAETDGEAAARLIKEFLDQRYLRDISLYLSPTREEIYNMFSNFLSGKRIPHSFASATLVEAWPGSEKWTSFPLIILKGKAIDPLHYFKYQDNISADKIPDIDKLVNHCRHLHFYNHICEVPPYSQTQVAKPEAFGTYGFPEWKIEPIDLNRDLEF